MERALLARSLTFAHLPLQIHRLRHLGGGGAKSGPKTGLAACTARRGGRAEAEAEGERFQK